MCKSKSEGGLRCSAHTRAAMVSAAAALEAAKTRAAGASTPGQRDKANAALAKAQEHFDAKQVEFLTSPVGIELLESKAQEARLAGDEEKAARFQEQADANKAVRDEQKAVAAVMQANYNWENHHYRFDVNGFNKYTGFSSFAGWNYKTDSEYDAAGYNYYGRGKDGRDRDGFDLDGYDPYGYDRDGYNGMGFDRDGFDRDGFREDTDMSAAAYYDAERQFVVTRGISEKAGWEVVETYDGRDYDAQGWVFDDRSSPYRNLLIEGDRSEIRSYAVKMTEFISPTGALRQMWAFEDDDNFMFCFDTREQGEKRLCGEGEFVLENPKDLSN